MNFEVNALSYLANKSSLVWRGPIHRPLFGNHFSARPLMWSSLCVALLTSFELDQAILIPSATRSARNFDVNAGFRRSAEMSGAGYSISEPAFSANI